MSKQSNPFIAPYDHFQGYNKSIEALKNRPELVEFDKLCYELFHLNDSGKRLLELLDERFIWPSLVSNDNPSYEVACTWSEGFKAAMRLFKNAVKTHANRVKESPVNV